MQHKIRARRENPHRSGGATGRIICQLIQTDCRAEIHYINHPIPPAFFFLFLHPRPLGTLVSSADTNLRTACHWVTFIVAIDLTARFISCASSSAIDRQQLNWQAPYYSLASFVPPRLCAGQVLAPRKNLSSSCSMAASRKNDADSRHSFTSIQVVWTHPTLCNLFTGRVHFQDQGIKFQLLLQVDVAAPPLHKMSAASRGSQLATAVCELSRAFYN